MEGPHNGSHLGQWYLSMSFACNSSIWEIHKINIFLHMFLLALPWHTPHGASLCICHTGSWRNLLHRPCHRYIQSPPSVPQDHSGRHPSLILISGIHIFISIILARPRNQAKINFILFLYKWISRTWKAYLQLINVWEN